jgi:imidazolonepropionase-like amidohydrolase
VFEVTGADEARRVVRRQLRAGVDFIKLFTTAGAPSGRPEMTYEEIQAATEEAHKAGKHVAAHAMGTQGVINSLRAGVNTIEHGNGLTEELAAQMAKQGTCLVPTLSITYSMAYRGERWKTPQSVVEFARGELPGLMAGVRMARDAGVKIAAGTDPPRLDTVPMECAVLVEAGLTPMEAIVAATLRGAEILGRTDDFGTVRPGRRADLAAYGANPLDDIAVLERAEFIVKDGTVERDDQGRAATVT